MKFTKKINLLIITSLLLQSNINLAKNINSQYCLSFIGAANAGNLEYIKIALNNPQIDVNYQCGGVDGRNDVGDTALMKAARRGHVDIVKLLLNAGADPNIVDKSQLNNCELGYEFGESKWGYTALMHAISANNVYDCTGKNRIEIVKLLLEAGADPNIQTLNGDTPLIEASQRKYMEEEIISLLLSYKADSNIKRNKRNLITSRPQYDWTALIYAANEGLTKVVSLLLKAGANPNIKDDDGVTALKRAALKGYTEIVSLLLKAGANPNIKDDDGVTALNKAALKGYTEIVSLLLKAGANPNIKVKNGVTALIDAAYNNHIDVVKELINTKRKFIFNFRKTNLNATNRHGMTALIWAADQGHVDVVKLLLDAGADPHITEEKGLTALIIAADKSHTEIVRLLLDAGTDPNIKDKYDQTALTCAAYMGNAEVIKLLINAHSDLNAQTKKEGLTALMNAADKGHVDVVKLLLDAGADPHIKDNKSYTKVTALYYAERSYNYRNREEIVQLIKNAQKNRFY
jgi:ankyrin repeat protein